MADQDFNIKVVTTADTTGIRQTSAGFKQIQQDQEKASQSAAQLVSSQARGFIGAGSFGYIVARVINGIAEETNKVTAELDKQGAHLVELSQKWTDMAKAATSSEDVAKIAASGAKEIEALGKAITNAATPDFSIGQTVVDNLIKRFMNLGRETEDALGPNEELAKALFDGLALDQQKLIEINANAIELGRTFQKAFEKRQAEPLADALAEVADEMAKAKNEQDALTGAMLKTQAGIDQYNKLSVTLGNLTRQTDLLTASDSRRQRQAEATARAAEKKASDQRQFEQSALESASPQAKAILRNEEAARQARAAGDERSADLFQKSAEQFRRSASPDQQSEALQLGKLLQDGNTILSQILAQFR